MDTATEYMRVSRLLSHGVKRKILLAARSYLQRARFQHTDAGLRQSAKDALRGYFPSVTTQELEVLVFYLICRVAIAEAKVGQVSKKDIGRAEETVKEQLDTLSEMGEMESLRLQMSMDRLSKLTATLSNLLKKASETAAGITQNIK